MIKKIMKILSSVKLAVALIFILSAFSLIGILLPQVPAAFFASSDGYVWWIDHVAYAEMGTLAYSPNRSVFSIYPLMWFFATALLPQSTSLSAPCRGSRDPGKMDKTAVSPPEFYRGGPASAEFASSLR
jgi:hypothetical protein